MGGGRVSKGDEGGGTRSRDGKPKKEAVFASGNGCWASAWMLSFSFFLWTFFVLFAGRHTLRSVFRLWVFCAFRLAATLSASVSCRQTNIHSQEAQASCRRSHILLIKIETGYFLVAWRAECHVLLTNQKKI